MDKLGLVALNPEVVSVYLLTDAMQDSDFKSAGNSSSPALRLRYTARLLQILADDASYRCHHVSDFPFCVDVQCLRLSGSAVQCGASADGMRIPTRAAGP